MAIDKERDEKIYQRWLVELPFMEQNNFVSFDEFKEKLTPKRKLSDIEQVSIVSSAYAILEKSGGG